MRTLDILSSGGLCVSGYNEGVDRNLMTSSVYPPQTLQLQRPPRRPTMLRPPTCPILIQLRIIKVHCRRDGSVALITSVARITSITALAPRLEQHHLNRANRWYKPFANARRFQEIVGQDTPTVGWQQSNHYDSWCRSMSYWMGRMPYSRGPTLFCQYYNTCTTTWVDHRRQTLVRILGRDGNLLSVQPQTVSQLGPLPSGWE